MNKKITILLLSLLNDFEFTKEICCYRNDDGDEIL